MASVDIVSKFSYLEHGKQPSKNSSFKGIVTTASIVGWKKYTERAASKVLSSDAKAAAQKIHSFFGYTSQRVGATKTFSNEGWIDSKQKDYDFRESIRQSFNKDGHLLWVPVISLEDFNTSFNYKLFNEEDYAAVIEKVLPKWFASAGFKNDNMIWWMDHHVNTDNPHIHFSFLEKEQTKTNGKLSMKDMNRFKTLFWNEVFSRQSFLEKTGQQAIDVFKQKDLLKKDIVQSFQTNMNNNLDEHIERQLQSLFEKLPSSGRLQYGSVHMKDYRSELDAIVEQILTNGETNDLYQEFISTIKQFDDVRNEGLHTQQDTMLQSEDAKLKRQLANTILQSYKNTMNDIKKDALTYQINDSLYLPVAKSLLKNMDQEQVSIKVPGSKFQLQVARDQVIPYKDKKDFFIVTLPKDFKQESTFKDETKSFTKENLFHYFSNGESFYFSKNEKEQRKDVIDFLKQKEVYGKKHNIAKSTLQQSRRTSHSWIKKIQREVEQAQEEYYKAKEQQLS